jgi:hypothetical protein
MREAKRCLRARQNEQRPTTERQHEFCHKVQLLKTSYWSESHQTPLESDSLFGLLTNNSSFSRRANIRQLTYITQPELRFSGIHPLAKRLKHLCDLGITSARLKPGANEREMQPPSLLNW